MEKIYVVGKTTPQEIYVASTSREFVLDEYLIIEDKIHDNPVGEVIETYSFPKVEENTFPIESGIYNSLKELNMLNENALYMGKMKILEERYTPISVGVTAREPEFKDLEKLLIKASPKSGFTLGVIKGTESLQGKLPNEFQNIAPLFDTKKGIIPQQGIPFIFDYYKIREYPGIGIFGSSGSGKSFALRVICEEIMQKGIPGIALDPHYELVFNTPMEGLDDKNRFNYANKYEILQVGVNVGIKFTDLTTEELISLMEFIADLSQPMRSAIQELHEKNDSFTTLFSRIEKLKIAFENQEKPEHERESLSEDIVLLYVKHRNKIAGASTLQAVAWRLDQLNKTGIFSHDISLVESCMLKRKLAIIRGDLRLLRMLASYVIKKLYKKRRRYKDWEQANYIKDDMFNQSQKFPPFFVIMDEAHNFAPNSNYTNPTKSVLREIGQEARKYGVFLILGTQRPALLDTTITAQLNTKIIFRTGIESDMNMIKTETNLTPTQVSRLPDLTSGNAFVSSATLFKTLYVRFRTTKTKSPHAKHPFDELDDFNSNSKLKEIMMDYFPFTKDRLPMYHSEINRKAQRNVTLDEIIEVLEEMAEQNEIEKEESLFGNIYRKK